ncbi:sensor histidine kinase [Desulfomonile tiedjei]|uniref:histidine kinase n=1 Tax=Desulfomonile tiedjei (strain ATCC 49306 / DSM 6799 / DCB-1) TaxID=706587 RepID=I4CBN9_DESTA|nr:sensor histidine kinase [Desulfomonile tiedjei]AFM26980.1 histidine kinase [Desulfomonile tiedjei DSM 6799]
MNDDQNQHYYKSLTRRIIVTMVVVSIIPLLLISGTIRYFFQVSYQEKVQDHLKVLIKKHRQNIDTFLNEKLANIKELSESYTFEQLSNEAVLAERLKVLQEVYGRSFVDLGVVNEEGIQIAYAGPFRLRLADYSKAPWFNAALKNETYISDVFPGKRGIPHFIVTVLNNYAGKKWILRATVDFDSFNSLVENLRMGETGFAFILNRKGELQTKPRTEIVASTEPYASFLTSNEAVGEDVLLTEMPGKSGQEVIYVLSRLKNGDWILAFQQTAEDAYSALYTARRIALVIFALGVLCIVAVAVILTRRVVMRIMTADKEKQMLNERVIEAGKLASLGELAAGIAHEINNPVAVMVEEAGWIQDLLEEEDLKDSKNLEEFKQSLKQIRVQGVRCKEITHKLLSFARKTDPRPRDVQLNELVDEVVNLCQQRARYATVKINTELDPQLPQVHASPTEMQQVIMNLINNSLDAIDGRGGVVEVKTSTKDDYVVLEVADNGPGIPEAYLPRIFDPFFTTKPVGKGTGLGLSICYGIITKMGGKISVSSAIEMGTTFHIRIPIHG